MPVFSQGLVRSGPSCLASECPKDTLPLYLKLFFLFQKNTLYGILNESPPLTTGPSENRTQAPRQPSPRCLAGPGLPSRTLRANATPRRRAAILPTHHLRVLGETRLCSSAPSNADTASDFKGSTFMFSHGVSHLWPRQLLTHYGSIMPLVSFHVSCNTLKCTAGAKSSLLCNHYDDKTQLDGN